MPVKESCSNSVLNCLQFAFVQDNKQSISYTAYTLIWYIFQHGLFAHGFVLHGPYAVHDDRSHGSILARVTYECYLG